MEDRKVTDIAAAFYGKHPEAEPDKEGKKTPEATGKVFTRTGGRLFRY